MARDARSNRNGKDVSSGNSKDKQNSSPSNNASSLRRSTRGTPSKIETNDSPLGTRKSERLEKRPPPHTPVKKQVEKADKTDTPSPLRRSGRGKNIQPSTASSSRKSDKSSSSSELKLKRKRSDDGNMGKNSKFKYAKERLNARSYRALFKPLKKKLKLTDSVKQRRLPENAPADSCSGECSGSVKGHDALKGSEASNREKLLEVNSCLTNGLHIDLTKSAESPRKPSGTENSYGSRDIRDMSNLRDDACHLPTVDGSEPGEDVDWDKRMHVESCTNEKLQNEVLHRGLEPMVDKKSGFQNDENPGESKRERNENLMVSLAQGRHADASSSPSGTVNNCSVEDPTSSPKSQRVDGMKKKEPCSGSTNVTEELRAASWDLGEHQTNIKIRPARCSDQNREGSGALLDNQTENGSDSCLICKLGGDLLYCCGKGCRRRYHTACIDPLLRDAGPVASYCPCCNKRKLELGVHSVSEGVESVWDVRDVEVPTSEGLQQYKEYFVKYKNLAHVHNIWVSEAQLLMEAPLVVASFQNKKEATKWNPDWSVPHRLLKKRPLVIPNHHEDHEENPDANNLDCHYEWLVKWCDLDYDHVSWELDNATFFNILGCHRLFQDYEIRFQKRRPDSSTREDEVQERGDISPLKVIPGGKFANADRSFLASVNKLREYWHKGDNVIVIDEQDRVPKFIGLIVSLLSSIAWPFLVITPRPLLHSWEVEFHRLSPSTNLVVYCGSKHAREIIRRVEFNEDGRLMLDVLLLTPEVLHEDLEFLKGTHWGTVIIDDCQNSDILGHSSVMNMLNSTWRVLGADSPLKDTATDYLNILSLLYSDRDAVSNVDLTEDSNHGLSLLKERLFPFMVYGCKSDAPRLLEYWVPVQISNVQLEHYCASLLSSSTSLRSCSKSVPVDAIRDVLISTRKCCNHPYLVNGSLQSSLTNGLSPNDMLNIGVKASGKLELLVAMLSEIKEHGIKVLILFQSIGGSGRDVFGEILEDVVIRKFGSDSYERIDGGVPSKIKKAALTKFNQEKGTFIFLLETRACHASIKLTSVDAVFIFNSDWNPLNDVRALQKINIHSVSGQIYVFRLYSSCTVEEKILMLAKNDVILGNTLQFSLSTSHMLLMWGASYLFTKLEEFHRDDEADRVANIAPDSSLFKNVLQELSLLIGRQSDIVATKFISRAHTQFGGNYLKDTPLLGLQQNMQMDEGLPHVFWTNLLGGRQPKWKYLSYPLQRAKKMQYSEVLPKQKENTNEESPRKRKKVGYPNIESSSPEVAGTVREGNSGFVSKSNPELIRNNSASRSPRLGENDANSNIRSEEKRKSRDAQKSLFQLLKPKISLLCEILQLPEDVRNVAVRFMEYVTNHHRVSQDPESALQAFQICVCWIAASLRNHNIDHKESLELVQRRLNFSCNDEADYLFSKMQLLKKMFLLRSEESKELKYQEHSSEENGRRVKLGEDDPVEAVAVQGVTPAVKSDDKQVNPPIHIADVARREISKKIKKVMKKLTRKQSNEIEEFNKSWEAKKASLKSELEVRSRVICSVHSNLPIRMDKLKVLNSEFERKSLELESEMALSRKELDAKHQDEKEEEKLKSEFFLKEIRSWAQSFDDGIAEQIREREGSNDSAATSEKLQEVQNLDNVANSDPDHEGTVKTSEDVCAADALGNNTTDDTSANIQVENLPSSSAVATNRDVSCEPAAHILTTDESLLRGSSKVVPPVSSSALNESMEGINSTQMPGPDAGTVGVSDKVAMASDRNTAHITSQNLGDLISPIQSSLPVAGQDGLLHESQGHGGELREPHGEQGQELPETTAVASNHAEGLPSDLAHGVLMTWVKHRDGCSINDQLCDDAAGNLPGRVAVSESASTIPLGNEQSGLSASENQQCPRTSLGNQNCADSIPRDSSQRPTAILVGRMSGPNLVQPERNSVTRGLTLPSANNQSPIPFTVPTISQVPPPLGNEQSGLSVSENQQCPRTSLGNQNCADNLPRDSSHRSADGSGPNLVQPERYSVTRGVTLLSENNQIPIPFTVPTISQVPLPLSSDPLHNELERLRKETDEVYKVHEEMILRLNSDCEKEIEEFVTQIRRRYNSKIQEADTFYGARKQQLAVNHNKVLMNKLLAEAFRSKCIDYRAASGQRQDMPPRIMQQPASRVSGMETGSFSGQPAPNLMGSEPPIRTSSSSGPFSNTPSRPPQISPTTPAAGSRLVRSDVRSSAPHLYSFRPPTSASSSTVQYGASNVYSPSSPSSSTFPSELLTGLWQGASLPDFQSGSRGIPLQPESVPESYPNSRLSSVVGASLGNLASQDSTLPSLPDFTRNSKAQELSGYGIPASIQPSSSDLAATPAGIRQSNPAATGDVVCLSDDD